MSFIAQLIVAILSGIVIALFEDWLDNRNDKSKKK